MGPRLRTSALVLLCALSGALPLRAQAGAAVEQVAQLLAAEDARRYDADLLGLAMAQPDPLVRRVAARSIGRIGDPRGRTLLVRALEDADSTVQTEAAFALGQLGDSAALPALVARLAEPRPLLPITVAELVTAIAKSGGPEAGAAFRSLLSGAGLSDEGDRWTAVVAVIRESWRLGADAPVDQLLPYLETDSTLARAAAFYTLGRLRAFSAGNRILAGLHDQFPEVRASAARTLTRAYADSARLGRAGVIGQLEQACSDQDAGVRIQAARSLGTYRGEPVRGTLAPLLEDQMPNVAVAAAEALGAARERAAAGDLKLVAMGKSFFALRRAALLALARLDPNEFAQAQGAWAGSGDWRDRAAAAEGWGLTGGIDSARMAALLNDRDPRVVAAGLQGWLDAAADPAPRLLAAARARVTSADVAVRSNSADVLARVADLGDIAALVAAYRISARDSVPDAAFSILGALEAIGDASEEGQRRVMSEFVAGQRRSPDYSIRLWARDHWPELSAEWGAPAPATTTRSMQDYRDLADRYIVTASPDQVPHVIVETSKGSLGIDLLGSDAPLTVANFLTLVDRGYFNGLRWHRVVPNFVVQDGDPRGDGWGGPGWSIRDEINRVRYGASVVGMALSGPDTGGSQWFITLGPQPSLDGTYTVFGKVVDDQGTLVRLTQGDVIKSIHR